MEIWKSVVEYPELFEVSSTGKIRNKRNKRELKQHLHKHGYYHIASKIGGRKGKYVCFKVHREVAKAFIPNPLGLTDVNHKDGNKRNNLLLNLEWMSSKENRLHAISLGLGPIPEIKHKLKDEDIEVVKSLYKPYDKKFGSRALARKYGVSHVTILKYLNS